MNEPKFIPDPYKDEYIRSGQLLEQNGYSLDFANIRSLPDISSHVSRGLKKTPTDSIVMTSDDVTEFVRLTMNARDVVDDAEATVPSDIILANTIPLRDFMVTIIPSDKDLGYEKIEYTFHVFDEYLHLVFENPAGEKPYTMSAIMPEKIMEYVKNRGEAVSHSLSAIDFASLTTKFHTKDHDVLKMTVVLCCDMKYINVINGVYEWTVNGTDWLSELTDKFKRVITEPYHAEFWNRYNCYGVGVFYAINTALLNPVIKEVFVNHTTKIPFEVGSAKNGKRPKIKYIKQQRISIGDIDAAFEKRGFVRKAMIWYVTGHWREYSKTGKRIFIQGYWKGALRNMKDTAFQNLEPRERELVTKEETENG